MKVSGGRVQRCENLADILRKDRRTDPRRSSPVEIPPHYPQIFRAVFLSFPLRANVCNVTALHALSRAFSTANACSRFYY